MSYLSRFRSPQAAQNYLAAYETTLALWPSPHDTLDVTTRFGITHVNSAGSPDAPPLVLIHGAQTSSTVWYPNIEALSRYFRVYAPDVVDQSGRSVPTRKLLNRQDCADWLCDVLDALNIERAAFIGHSHGGWQVLNLAMTASRRVDRMILLSPAGITRLRMEVFLRLLPAFIVPTKRVFYWSFQWSTFRRLDVQNPDPVIDQIRVGGTSFKANELSFGVVNVFDDAELRDIAQPTCLLVGDQEKIFHPDRMVERALRLMPRCEAEIIPNAAHLLLIDQPETINLRMITFLSDFRGAN
jgi:pimeloyl-ACP methyl ester carboxylesterase